MSDNLDILRQLASKPAALEWFRGLFRCLHLELTDTGETFTVVHHGDHVAIEPGLQDRPNFVVPLESENLRNLEGFFADERIDPYEEYRIVKFMLQPCLKAALAMPILQNDAFCKVVKIDSHWQEALLDPEGREDEPLTILHVNRQWLVVPGYHGRPQRRLVMTPAQILEYQRRVFAANEANSLAGWLELGRWYVQWRDEVSAAAA